MGDLPEQQLVAMVPPYPVGEEKNLVSCEKAESATRQEAGEQDEGNQV
ncbi:MAG: hypothetical protein WAM66_11800 [Acidobacteriaceae bacterium]